MSRLLFITTSFPPFPESQSIRNFYFVRALSKRGWAVTVLTPLLKGPPDSFLSQPVADSLVRLGPSMYDRVASGLLTARPAKAFKLAHRMLAVAAGRLIAPDVRADWAIRAYRAVKKQDAFDLIISASGSNASHLAASWLKGRWGAPWIAEMGDPWSQNPLPPASKFPIRQINRWLERRHLRKADRVVVTTEELASVLSPRLPRSCVVIPCGHSMDLPGLSDGNTAAKLQLAYVGTAHKGSRNLASLMKLIDEAFSETGTCADLILVGDVSDSFLADAKAQSHISTSATGWVDYISSLEWMRRANVLLLIGNASRLQVPGKIYNYLRSGKPILYWSQMPAQEDPTWRVLSTYPGVVKIGPDPFDRQPLVDFIEDFAHISEQAKSRVNDPRLNSASWDHLADRFADLADCFRS